MDTGAESTVAPVAAAGAGDSFLKYLDSSHLVQKVASILAGDSAASQGNGERPESTPEARPKSPARCSVSGAPGSLPHLLAAYLYSRLGKTVLVLCPDLQQAEAARDDIEFFLGSDSVLFFPEEDHSLTVHSWPSSLRNSRITCLARLALNREPLIVVASARAQLRKVPSPRVLRDAVVHVKTGVALDPDELAARLGYLGYNRVPAVESYGDWSRRGGIVDVFTYGRENPLRIEFGHEEVESVREFDPVSQRSVRSLGEALVLPTHELVLDAERIEAAADYLEGLESEAQSAVAETVRHNVYFEGVEWLAGLYDQILTTPLSYITDDAVIVEIDPSGIEAAAREREEEIERFLDRSFEPPFPLPYSPHVLFSSSRQIAEKLGASSALEVLALGSAHAGAGERAVSPAVIRLGAHPQEPVARSMSSLRSYLERLHESGLTTYILCDNTGQRDRLEEILGRAPATLQVGVISGGFSFPDAGFSVLTDHQIFERFRRRRRRRAAVPGVPVKQLMSLRPGNYLVHVDHGIGVYRGLRRLVVDGHETDCLHIDYAMGDRLFIPADQLHLLQKYVAEEGRVPNMSRLGTGAWSRTKARVKKAVKDMAEGLIKAYAIRKARPGHAYPPDDTWQAELESSFKYEETPDQAWASREIKKDMESDKPMDRLVCGDVGYGKTELAVRAAFKAVTGGKQVALLVPTTVLAEQHLVTFRERIESFPVKIEVLSRFKSRGEQKKILKALEAGDVDIVIGTHRLLQKDVKYKDLGLVIIDEEQRFGVAHKEKIRGMKSVADVLTMTATPIPRTLHMSLMGARDMSVINTAPKGRFPIHTEILDFNDDVIGDAILREVDRGGQCFFIHNWVQSIDPMAVYLSRLVPQVRIAVAHGQMAEKKLESVMLEFMEKKYDVLVSSMIVESGLDMPNVNTIIINRADRFGLAQLYQLRGRVGRSHVKAHAYLLIPPRRALTEEAMKRLRVLEEFEDLGAGFKIALRDLEIRGAGNLLGPEQHGFLWSVGFDMYCKLLEEAVRELKGEEVESAVIPKMVTDLDAYLPDDYVPDGGEKVNLYKRIAETLTTADVDSMQEELTDRFGDPPPQAKTLLDLRRVRILAGRASMGYLSVKRGMVEAEGSRELTAKEVRGLLSDVSLPVELYGKRKFGIRLRTGQIDPLRPALTLFSQMAKGLKEAGGKR
jgi:transcription-repair coupling factor (superfamily II helicase)